MEKKFHQGEKKPRKSTACFSSLLLKIWDSQILCILRVLGLEEKCARVWEAIIVKQKLRTSENEEKGVFKSKPGHLTGPEHFNLGVCSVQGDFSE